MPYTPINIAAYVASYSGAIAGMAVTGWIVAAHSLTLADSLGHYVYGILGGMFITTTDYASEGLISIQFFGQYLVAPNN